MPPPAEYLADLHVHSHLSRATSAQCDVPHLAAWAQRKGLGLLATGDFTHPAWLAHLEEHLEEDGSGLLRLRPAVAAAVAEVVPPACRADVRFVLEVEISSIYRRDGQVRKVHNLVFVPDLDTARRLRDRLGRIGNLGSDGRPILGLDSRDLLEIALECSPRSVLIPAHLWTPWFSMLGSKSGFDSVAACFADLTPHVFAAETGLSSDPPMNWRLSGLDRLTLISNSDAHSPQKLGREANVLATELAYDAVFDALRSADPERWRGTVEFYPEEGKYHLDGCRACSARLTPEETRQLGGRCPTCGKLVTVGVLARVEALADRPVGARSPRAAPFVSLVPLDEVLGEALGAGPATRGVERAYARLLAEQGPELAILRTLPPDEAARSGPPLLGEALRRVRAGELHLTAGYDGEFGEVRIFAPGERERLGGQGRLFVVPAPAPAPASASAPALAPAPVPMASGQLGLFDGPGLPAPAVTVPGLTPPQWAVVDHQGTPLLVVAGPGSGKTRTLTRRLAHLVEARGVPAGAVLAVTFTHRAAGELRHRLTTLLGPGATAITVTTFHGLALALLRRHAAAAGLRPDLVVLGEAEAAEAFALAVAAEPDGRTLARRHAAMRAAREGRTGAAAPEVTADLERYRSTLDRLGALDFAELVPRATALLGARPDLVAAERERLRAVAVDEYQDIDPGQRDLLRCLVGPRTDLCAIGDPDQSIYGFRGAEVSLFAGFPEDFPGATRLGLDRSFRTPAAALAAATAVVARSRDHGRVPLASSVPGPDHLPLHTFPDEVAEAAAVARAIEQALGGTTSLGTRLAGEARDAAPLGLGDVAVLGRTGQRLEAVTEALRRAGLPVDRPGAAEADAADEAALVALLRTAGGAAPAADWGLLPRRAGLAAAESATLAAGLLGVPEAALAAPLDGLRARAISTAARRAVSRVAGWQRLLVETTECALADARAGDVLPRAAGILGIPWPPPPTAARLGHLRVLAAAPGPVTRDLLDLRATEARDLSTPRGERLAVLTLHASKGLEWSAVFIVGLESGTLPWQPDPAVDPTPAERDEERRLLYVGMTRTRGLLWLSGAARVVRRGRAVACAPCPFLDDVPARLLRRHLHEAVHRVRQLELV